MAFYGPHDTRQVELASALESARRAVEPDPRDAFNRHALGRTLGLLLRFGEARDELEQAIELNHSFARAYFAAGFVLMSAGSTTRNAQYAARSASQPPPTGTLPRCARYSGSPARPAPLQPGPECVPARDRFCSGRRPRTLRVTREIPGMRTSRHFAGARNV
jgi:tetratricopeptide (TPR) repeat protein